MTTRSTRTLENIKRQLKGVDGSQELFSKTRTSQQQGYGGGYSSSKGGSSSQRQGQYQSKGQGRGQGQQRRSDNRSKFSRNEPHVYSSVNEGLEDLNIKRPRNGYILFTLDYRDQVEKEGFNGPDAVAELARRWKNLDPKEKRKYNKMGDMESERYFREKDSAGIITPSKRRGRRSYLYDQENRTMQGGSRGVGKQTFDYNKGYEDEEDEDYTDEEDYGEGGREDEDREDTERRDRNDKTFFRRLIARKNRMSRRRRRGGYSNENEDNQNNQGSSSGGTRNRGNQQDNEEDDDEYNEDNQNNEGNL